jgi:flagellar assembly protein FliH
VAAEEKKSLSNDENRSFKIKQSNFRLHCFPDIPGDGQSGVRRCTAAQDNFQRTEYDRNDSACMDSAAGLDKSRPLAGKTALTAREREERAFHDGFADGIAQGLREGEQRGVELGTRKIEPLITGIKEALTQLNAIREETYQQIEKEVVTLALAIAQKIICREVSTDKETVVCVAKKALAKVDDPGNIKIMMNPSDLQFINETKYQLSNLIADVNHVTFEGEDSIQSGGCIIETELGEIDARIEKQLQAIEESFENTLTKTSTAD